jgi:site-specific DNA-adenine methylase
MSHQQDGTQSLFYLDPPYPDETRTAHDVYAYEMSIDDHAQLLATLTRKREHFSFPVTATLVTTPWPKRTAGGATTSSCPITPRVARPSDA